MTSKPNRIIIYPKDVMAITGCTYRTACKTLARVRKKLNKEKGTPVTRDEFSQVKSLKPEELTPFLVPF